MQNLRAHPLRSVAGLFLASVWAAGCATTESRDTTADELARAIEVEFEGGFDGESFYIAPVGPARVLAADGHEVGVVEAPILATVDSGAFGSGVTATGTDYVALEQQASSLARIVNNVASGAAWNPTRCGPTPQTGTCVQIRMRNLYADRQLQHAHFELTELTRTGSTSNVYVSGPALNNDVAPWDTYYGVRGAGGGLWNYGTVRRASPPGVGPVLYWAFLGTTSSTFTYSFRGRVRADLVRPPIRADLATGTSDGPPSYGAGTPGNGTVSDVHVDSAGRFVVFTSDATNLVAGTPTGVQRVYRADVDTNTVELVSTGSALAVPLACDSAGASVSNDGQVVAFESDCALEPGDTNGVRDVYVRRIADGGTILASRSFNAAGTAGNAPSSDASISGSGRYVVFTSVATNLALYRPAGRTFLDVYRRNVGSLSAANVEIVPVTRLSTGLSPVWLDASSSNPVVGDASGTSVIVFESTATNAVATADTNGVTDIFAFVHGASSTVPASRTMVSVSSSGGALAAASVRPAVSNDGNIIAFDTAATGVVPGVSGQHVYVRARATASSIALVDVTPAATASTGGAFGASLSDTGRYVTFASNATDLTLTGVGGTQLYLRDRFSTDRAFQRAFAISLDEALTPVGGGEGVISGSGEYAVLVSSSPLVTGSSGTHAFRVPYADVREQ